MKWHMSKKILDDYLFQKQRRKKKKKKTHHFCHTPLLPETCHSTLTLLGLLVQFIFKSMTNKEAFIKKYGTQCSHFIHFSHSQTMF